MDLKDTLQRLSENISKMQDSLQTEEATKNAFIMPMIAALGYDVFNPFEVVPEMDCDLTKNKGEKIDYAIMKDSKPIILIECKHCKQNLDLHSTQLQKYFVASNARFAVLTNGVEYRFYTDLEKVNIMDEKPFLVINMLDLSDADIDQLKKFHKSYYNEADILSTANELKYTTELKSILNREMTSPSPEFVKFFAKQVYSGSVHQGVIAQFTPLVKKSIQTIINDIISDRLNSAMKSEEQQGEQNEQKNEDAEDKEDNDSGIVTTQEEIDAYNIIRSILCSSIDVKRIKYKDNKTYFTIYVDSPWSWICRLYLGCQSKNIWFPAQGYKASDVVKKSLNSIDDLFSLSDEIKEAMLLAKTTKENWDSKHNK